jgi:glycosyltransferase involved in cell wall biosynthesis
LSRLGHRIHLIATVKQEPEATAVREVQSRVARLDIVLRRRGWLTALGWKPFQTASRTALREVELEAGYDVALLESEFVQPILENPRLHCRKVALRIHNDEASYARDIGRSERSPLRKAFFHLESVRMKSASGSVLKQADQLWFISGDYHRSWSAKQPESADKAWWVPPPLDLDGLRQPALSGRKVLAVGNLVAPTNLEGIGWYLDHVHPRLCRLPGYQFTVAGALLGGGIPKRLCSLDDRVRLVTNAEELRGYYQESAVFVNPMQRGVSLKLKTVNAVENGLPVVTTTVGNEGTGFKDGVHLLERNSPEAFAAAVEELLDDAGRRRELAGAAQRFLVEHYDHRRHLEQLLDKLMETGK